VRTLITGVGGFVGQHLTARLLASGDSVTGIARRPVLWRAGQVDRAARFDLILADLTHPSAATRAVHDAAADRVVHLAAQSSVSESFMDPMGTLHNNAACLINVLEAVRSSGHRPRILVVSSAEVYGRARDGRPIDELAPLCPESPYAVSKAALDLLGYQYHVAYGLDVVRVRPFTHIGPGQSDRFVAASFARQIVEIERGAREPVIAVGNLAAKRDFTDVRDMVGAYELALLNGEPGAVYNIGRGAAVSIQALLEQLIGSSRVPVTVRVDSSRLRSADAPLLLCDAARFRERTQWEARIPLEVTLQDILDYWRDQEVAA